MGPQSASALVPAGTALGAGQAIQGFFPAWAWKPARTETTQPLWAVHLLNTFCGGSRGAHGSIQSPLCSRLDKPSSPSFSSKGMCSSPHISEASPELPLVHRCLFCTGGLKAGCPETLQ